MEAVSFNAPVNLKGVQDAPDYPQESGKYCPHFH